MSKSRLRSAIAPSLQSWLQAEPAEASEAVLLGCQCGLRLGFLPRVHGQASPLTATVKHVRSHPGSQAGGRGKEPALWQKGQGQSQQLPLSPVAGGLATLSPPAVGCVQLTHRGHYCFHLELHKDVPVAL